MPGTLTLHSGIAPIPE